MFIVLITGNLLNAQSKYPADTLLTSDSLNLIQKTGILPIAAWQRISYNLPGFGCQFYPSCSNYGTLAIKEYGLLAGSVVTADRIVRCNPFAWHYHLQIHGGFHPSDGRLVDPVIPNPAATTTAKSPYLAAVLSAVIPGSGRAYARRPWDGLMGFMTVALTVSAAYSGLSTDRPIEGGIFLSFATIFYTGEIYGAWRAAKYYQPTKLPVN
ncbi:MAG: membrane protein insertion efficiency factor YidD [Candidatus Marinimicrobia bacterium]|nr:membrane protein insertion efficiency factor YidD [Candidatus Neomarinimicrobiota bacterium]